MPVPSKGSLGAVQPSDLGRLCYKTTARDLAGEALHENGRVRNMRAMRESRGAAAAAAAAAAGTRRTTVGRPSSGGSAPPTPGNSFGLYTLYSGDFHEKPNMGASMDRDLAKSFKPPPSDRPMDLGCEGSTYGNHFSGCTPSRVAAAKPSSCPAPDNKLGGLIMLGNDPVTASSSTRHFVKPPEELVRPTERMPYLGCPYWLGAGTSAGSFKESRYQLEFKHGTSSPKRPQLHRAAASAPDLAAPAEGGAEAQFRNATMRSHYKSHFSTAHQGPPGLRPPRAADIRQTIIGR